ncbi:hypothetical protein QJS04_geneDACA009429 [Acorus gramineus]|uniref:G-patch domain-containing protein n=1 Tax=Acorus gramineus TaxID=55184 RepID=A0AAV9AJ54_ACOGR|nr:hypothetical protein QJS04_geneDACA009429 [Acorus gramineus]
MQGVWKQINDLAIGGEGDLQSGKAGQGKVTVVIERAISITVVIWRTLQNQSSKARNVKNRFIFYLTHSVISIFLKSADTGFYKITNRERSFNDDNTLDIIGMDLLKRSGWKEGTGLGVLEQGRLEPLETHMKKNKRGIGAEKVKKNVRKLREDSSSKEQNKNIMSEVKFALRLYEMPSLSLSNHETVQVPSGLKLVAVGPQKVQSGVWTRLFTYWD